MSDDFVEKTKDFDDGRFLGVMWFSRQHKKTYAVQVPRFSWDKKRRSDESCLSEARSILSARFTNFESSGRFL